MKISFENVVKLLDKIDLLKRENRRNNDYYRYHRLYKKVCWYIFYCSDIENECVELDKKICDRLGNLINEDYVEELLENVQ